MHSLRREGARNGGTSLLCRISTAATLAAAIAIAGGAAAQDAGGRHGVERDGPSRDGSGRDGPRGRFAFQPVDDGIMRLDTETGQVSHCRRAAADYICRSVADDRAALEDEIARLRRENEQLRLGRAAPTPAQPPPAGRGLPSDEDFDRTLSLMERFMRRMMGIMREDTQKPL